MRTVFVDTSYFIALVMPRDQYHALAERNSEDDDLVYITHSWVIVEIANYLCDAEEKDLFLGILAELKVQPGAIILPPDNSLYERGIDLYSRRRDKNWSLTDCISFIVMEERGLTEALTADHHFEQAGFRALLRTP